ncbi:Protein of uncharacterised function (DUF721) [Phocoenobacter uteri]|uniref:Protein of uncharacterized function (DUF721) n=1 Tax=Phocoenobacter uteri TaxID=146806 RepID=A0A379CC44_9PAST|nr:DciA family protein [Phocoenobacter uteri]MDG6881271.1 hypothetical protein [Phocoenobacter uteri]SUB59296.1 Protein of uncharacterised function (DUF721) [Phocoenobacter uteri]
MKKSTIKNIKDILKNAQLIHIVERANLLNDLNYKIQQRLPDSYRGLYRVVNLVDNQLVLEVQNATVKSGLQLKQEELLALIRIDFTEVTGLLFRINPRF